MEKKKEKCLRAFINIVIGNIIYWYFLIYIAFKFMFLSFVY